MSRIAVMAVAAALIAPGPGAAQTPPPAAERFVLSGVVSVEGGREMAWLQEPTLTRNQVVIARAGDRIGPYRLTRILADRVELDGPSGVTVIPLYNASRAEPPGATASLPRGERAPAAQAATAPVEDAVAADTAAGERGRRAWARRAGGGGPNAMSESRGATARAERDRRPADGSPEARAPAPSAEATAAAPRRPAVVVPPGDPRQRFSGFGLQ
jgi:hypothetical protein